MLEHLRNGLEHWSLLAERGGLKDAEEMLLAAGWEWVKEDAYDDAYYRQWMHELPPMIHTERRSR